VNIRVARIYSTFGPRMHMDDGRVVSSFILQALRNEPVTVMYMYSLWIWCRHIDSKGDYIMSNSRMYKTWWDGVTEDMKRFCLS